MSRRAAPKPRALGLAALVTLGTLLVSAPTASAQSGDDTLIIAMQKDIGNYNMFDLGSNTVWKSFVVSRFWDGLADVDTTGDVYPRLAESWTSISDDPASPDYLKVKVTLRPDLKFSDGTALTADDVVFSYISQRHAGSTTSSSLVPAFDGDDDGKLSKAEIEAGVVKLDARTIQFTLARKYGQFYKTTLAIPILPEHVWKDHLKADAGCEVCLDPQWNEPGAMVGSGPWTFVSGVKDSRYVIQRNDLFWGKDFRTPFGKHPLWSKNVKTIQFDIYASLESAILALRSGKVDHIPWTVTPGHIPGLAADPAAKLTFVSENGYYYLAFNEKREPMNDIAFRQAVSHLIDKRTIVDVYMGGFGQAGDSAEPPFWAEWYNASVRHYDFNKEKAKEILRTAGYRGAALGNGPSATLLRPDGSAMPPIVILTPPADYDPVRIKSGEFIAKNMRELGVDATAKAIDFNTLVGRMNGFDYQMLIIGWQLASDPVGNVCDVMGARSTQNYFGFWDPATSALDNPTYAGIGGVSTKADAPTRALVASVDANCRIARESFEPAVQVRAVKDVQGALAEAVPVNVLYYKTNAFATSSAWTGWVTHLGQIMNDYSLASVRRGADAAPERTPRELVLAIDAPAQIPVGEEREVRVAALQANGLPAAGAQLSVRVAGGGLTPSASQGTANSDGLWAFNLKGTDEGFATLYVNATLDARTTSAMQPVAGTAAAPDLIFLEGSPAKSFLAPGETTTVSFLARDRSGAPVPGARIRVDGGLLQWGEATLPTPTDDQGRAVLTYTAPAAAEMPANRHLEVGLVATAEKSGFEPLKSNALTLPLLVRGGGSHAWGIVELESVSRWAASPDARAVDLAFVYRDAAGAPLAGRELRVELSRPGEFAAAPSTITTGADGKATLPLAWTDGASTRAATVRVFDASKEDALAASATILYRGSDGRAAYGGYVSLDRAAADPDSATPITATVHLFDRKGNPPPGDVPLAVVVGASPFGQLAALGAGDLYTYSSLDDAASIQAATALDGRTFTTSGAFLGSLAETPTGPYPAWSDLLDAGYTGVDPAALAPAVAKNGLWSFKIDPASLPLADRKAMITVVPQGMLGHRVTDDEMNFYWTLAGDTAIGGEYAVWRTQKILATRWESDLAVYRTLGDAQSGKVRLEVVDQDNAPVEGAAARLYANGLLPPSRWPYAGTGGETAADGRVMGTLKGAPGAGYAARSGQHNAFGRHDLFVAAQKDGYANLIGSSHVLIAPIATHLSIAGGELRLADPAAAIELTISGKDESGKALAGWNVTLDSQRGQFVGLENATVRLGPDGEAKVSYKPASPSIVPWVLDTIKASAGGDMHQSAVAARSFLVVNAVPRVTVTSPGSLAAKAAQINLTGQVADADGVRGVQVRLDAGSFADVPVATGLPASGFVYALRNLAPGPHVITVRGTDQKGFVGETTVEFTVEAPASGGAEPTMWERLTPIPAAIGVVAVACAAFALRRR